MTTVTTSTKTDQLDAEGKKIDDYFTIKEVETIEFERIKTLSGTEVAQELLRLEEKKSQAEKQLLKITDEINFLKSLK